jgi:SAM-dependent methyltransferase
MGWYETYLQLAYAHPRFKKLTRQLFYQGLSTLHREGSWTFMNYGYAPPDPTDEDLGPERYCASLYRQVAGAVDLAGASVLEVGCGRGGGAAFVKSRLGAASVVGLDYASRSVSLCRRLHPLPGLSFVAGNAEALPFSDETFDAVLNVESSHCYASMETFFAEVHRVLRPDGRFLFADFRYTADVQGLDGAIAGAGFRVLRRADITANVVESLRADCDRRTEMIMRRAPRAIRHLVREFAGVEDSIVLREFTSGARRYLSWALAKAS